MKIAVNKTLDFIAVHMIKIAGIGVILLLLFPWFFESKYILRIATVSMMYIMIALSINLLTGFLGLMTMGHAAFWGIGAYTAAILSTRAGWGMGMCMIAAAVLTGIFGLLLGLPVLRLKGYFLTVVTLGFCEIIRLIEMNEMELTRGPLGIASIPPMNLFGIDLSSGRQTYYVMLVLMLITAVIIYRIIHSRIGIAIIAIREDDLAASTMGIHVFLYKVMVFIISAMIAGVAGAFYAHYINYIDPSSFTSAASMDMLVMAIFGGLGSIPGTILGASILTIIPETMRGLSQYRNLMYGVLIVVLMMIKPDGILGNVNFAYRKQSAEMEKMNAKERVQAKE